MGEKNHKYIVSYNVNGPRQYVVEGTVDSSSELHARRFADRREAEEEAERLRELGLRGVKIAKVGLRKGGI